ncbi:MAG: LLM class flavin-dependent oxidoreductase [Chloroflexi bacterium]|nr:LLM class flavin-dependent oxidoreductase [Chloroflexota bacterium]
MFETEHRAFGIEFGRSPGERLRWLEEAVRIMRGMLRGERPSGERFYRADAVRLDPLPLQERLPILIGGGGERKTLRIVARYADACNLGGGFANVKRRDEILRRHCDEVGRDESQIERTVGIGTCIIRDDPAEARRVFEATFAHNGGAEPWKDQLVGTPEQVADRLRPFLGIGFRHWIAGFPSPYDAETMERLVTEVKPMLAGG